MATAASFLAGDDTDLKRAISVIAMHKTKNYANSYLLPLTEEENAARESGDWKRELEAFNQEQANFHLRSNGEVGALSR